VGTQGLLALPTTQPYHSTPCPTIPTLPNAPEAPLADDLGARVADVERARVAKEDQEARHAFAHAATKLGVDAGGWGWGWGLGWGRV